MVASGSTLSLSQGYYCKMLQTSVGPTFKRQNVRRVECRHTELFEGEILNFHFLQNNDVIHQIYIALFKVLKKRLAVAPRHLQDPRIFF